MPITISATNIETKLSDLSALSQVISRWGKDLESAKKAEASLKKYQELSGAISSYIAQELSKKPNEKKGSRLVGYREELQRIKDNFSTKGLTSQINKRIEALESAQAIFQAEVEKREAQTEAALVEINRLLPLVTSIVDAYEKARLEDKEGLHAHFLYHRALLNDQVSLLSDKGSYIKQISELSHRVNKRTVVLAKEEEQLKAKIVAAAKEAEKVVDDMTINEQVLAIAPPKVQRAIQKLLAGVTTKELEQLLLGSDASDTALVTYAVNQVVAVTGKISAIGQELAVVSDLSDEDKLQVVQALLTGQNNELTASLSQSTQMALTAAVINQLAINSSVAKQDLIAIQEFSSNLVTSMARIERGEATHLSVLVEVENSDGEKEIRGFHIDLKALIENPVDLSALMALQLLKVGAASNAQIVTAFSSLEQVGALLRLQGKTTGSLALNGRSLQELTAAVLNDTSSLKQITNGEVDVSDKALIALTQNHHSIVTSTSGFTLGKHGSSKGIGLENGSLVASVLRALTIMQLTAVATVFDLKSQTQLGITPLIGNEVLSVNSTLAIEAGFTNTVAVAAATEQNLLTEVHDVVDTTLASPPPVDIVTDDVVNKTDDVSKKEETEPSVINPLKKKKTVHFNPNQQLINDFNAALSKLETLHASLDEKYGKNKDKQYIVQTSMSLITSLKTALKVYETNGNAQAFKEACEAAIDTKVKSAFNTHRDGAVKQFFGAIAEVFTNLWSKLFDSKEQYDIRNATRAGMAGFFQSQARTTKSADVLYDFNNDIEKAFKLVGVEADDDLDQKYVIQHGAH